MGGPNVEPVYVDQMFIWVYGVADETQSLFSLKGIIKITSEHQFMVCELITEVKTNPTPTSIVSGG